MAPRSRRARLALVTLTVALAAVVGANARVLGEGGARVVPAARVPESDAILVLGAGVHADGSPSEVLEDRLAAALALWQDGRAPRILVSGDHGRASYDEPNAMRRWLETRGVPREAIFMDHAGFDTYSSVWRARHVFGAERVIVVTQRFHLARALFVAGRVGMGATGVAADRRTYRGAAWHEAREVVSRAKAWVDVEREREPRFTGPRVELAGDGRVTSG
jgi:vancomycin permeability regulator SanA